MITRPSERARAVGETVARSLPRQNSTAGTHFFALKRHPIICD